MINVIRLLLQTYSGVIEEMQWCFKSKSNSHI